MEEKALEQVYEKNSKVDASTKESKKTEKEQVKEENKDGS